MEVKVKFDGQEIIVTKPGTDFMLGVSQEACQPESRSHAKLGKAYCHVAGDQRVSRHAFHTAVTKARERGHVLINEHCLSLALPSLLHLDDLIRSQSARTHFVVAPHA